MNSVVRLKAAFDSENVRLPVRVDGAGRQTGGGLISRGHLYKILSNPIYIGRLGHKGQVYEGQHAAIVDRALGIRRRPCSQPKPIGRTALLVRQMPCSPENSLTIAATG